MCIFQFKNGAKLKKSKNKNEKMFGLSSFEREMRKTEMKIRKMQAKAEILKYKSAIQNKRQGLATKKISHLSNIKQEMDALSDELAPKNPWIEVLNSPVVQGVLEAGISKLGGTPKEEKIANLGDKLGNLNLKQKIILKGKFDKFMKKLTPEQKEEGLQLVTSAIEELNG
jgi:hypothetical protein